MVESNRTWVR